MLLVARNVENKFDITLKHITYYSNDLSTCQELYVC